MNRFRFLVGALSLCALVAALSPLPASAKDPSEEEMMKMMAEMAAPGPHHQMMAEMAGTWDAKATFWMAPGAPPMESMGVTKMDMMLGGRFLHEENKSQMMGMPFEGHGLYGFDKGKNKHVGMWVDNMGTAIMYMEGDCAEHCGIVTLTGSFMDPMTNMMKTMKIVSKKVDHDHYTSTMYDVDAKGMETKTAVIDYSRKKGA